jgi:hypothetical protein
MYTKHNTTAMYQVEAPSVGLQLNEIEGIEVQEGGKYSRGR